MLTGDFPCHHLHRVMQKFGKDQIQLDRQPVAILQLLDTPLTVRGIENMLAEQILLKFRQFLMQSPVGHILLPRNFVRDDGLDFLLHDAPGLAHHGFRGCLNQFFYFVGDRIKGPVCIGRRDRLAGLRVDRDSDNLLFVAVRLVSHADTKAQQWAVTTRALKLQGQEAPLNKLGGRVLMRNDGLRHGEPCLGHADQGVEEGITRCDILHIRIAVNVEVLFIEREVQGTPLKNLSQIRTRDHGPVSLTVVDGLDGDTCGLKCAQREGADVVGCRGQKITWRQKRSSIADFFSMSVS